MASSNGNGLNGSHLAAGLVGGFIAAITISVSNSYAQREAKKSRAEKRDPNRAKVICIKAARALDSWELPDDANREDHFTNSLAAHLRYMMRCKVDVRIRTPCGCPDILIDDMLVIELKYGFSKAEADRCVTQCAAFADHWVTWVVPIDVST